MKTDRETLQKDVLQLLSAIAPELETDAMKPDQPLRHWVDLDSMDWLNFLVSLHEHYGEIIPESDYAKLVTLNDVVNYLQKKRI